MAKQNKPLYPHSGIDHPLWLQVDGQIVFHKIVLFLKDRGSWNDAYYELVSSAAGSYQNYVSAQKQINELGVIVPTASGDGIRQNPAIPIASSNFRDFMTFSNKFGLNPLFDNKVKTGDNEDSEI